jgi:hypothetical protein
MRRLTGTTLLLSATILVIATAGAAMASDGGGSAPAVSVPSVNQFGAGGGNFSAGEFVPPVVDLPKGGGVQSIPAGNPGKGNDGALDGVGGAAPAGAPTPDVVGAAAPVVDAATDLTSNAAASAGPTLAATSAAAPVVAPVVAPVAAPAVAPVAAPAASPAAAPAASPAAAPVAAARASAAPENGSPVATSTLAVPAVQTSVGVLAVLAVLVLFLGVQGRFDRRDPQRALERSDRDFIGFR